MNLLFKIREIIDLSRAFDGLMNILAQYVDPTAA
jgi:hypothetical protein